MADLLHGDCLEIMQTLEDESIDMVLTDPPYGTTACKWDSVIPFAPMWAHLKRIIKPDGAICLFGTEPFSSALRMSNIKMFKYDWIWDTGNKVTNWLNAKKQPMRRHEVVSVFYDKQTMFSQIKREGSYTTRKTKVIQHETHGKVTGVDFGRKVDGLSPCSVLRFDGKFSGKVHPTQKPVPLLEYLIKTYTVEGDICLDFTMGSGSTGVACQNLNRKFIDIEKDEKYFKIAEERIYGLAKEL